MNKQEIHTIARAVHRWRKAFLSGCKAYVLYNAGVRITRLPARKNKMSSQELAEFIRCLRVMGWEPKSNEQTVGPATWIPPKPPRKKRPRKK